jgi:hypothetical protein
MRTYVRGRKRKIKKGKKEREKKKENIHTYLPGRCRTSCAQRAERARSCMHVDHAWASLLCKRIAREDRAGAVRFTASVRLFGREESRESRAYASERLALHAERKIPKDAWR